MRYYIQITDYLNGDCYEEIKEDEDGVSSEDERNYIPKYICYTIEPQQSSIMANPSESFFRNRKKKSSRIPDLELMTELINNKEYYKTLQTEENYGDLDYVLLDKIFIQVELEQNGKKKCIHEYLESFYLKDNVLFTRPFLKWYLSRWFSIDLEEEYTLHIIDKDVNLFTVSPNQHIVLTAGKYEVVTNETN